MKIAFCSAEVAPFSQAGGLGDVIGSLPRAVAELGMDCVILTPLYGLIDPVEKKLEKTDITFDLHMGGQSYPIAIWKGCLPRSDVPVYFVDNYALFGCRKEVYPYGRPDWELEGFLVFSHAVFELLRRIHYRPDVLHAHDWHTAAVVTTLSDIRPYDQYYSRTQSVLTIHNLHYQGVYGDMNWLKEGILKADAITTVSPTYAREIQTPQFGAGLDAVVRQCGDKVSGILNGIDTQFYDPQTDAFIARNYNVDHVMEGKRACKAALQAEMDLPADPDAMLVGFVGRLVEQKGLDILLPAITALEAEDLPIQWALLGSGEPKTEEALKAFNASSSRVRSYIGFNTALAQKIYAGSDVFMMPSAFEPCGLGQLIALRYGTAPLVRSVGGLVDTVIDVRLQPHRGNGFRFHDYRADQVKETVLAALDAYRRPAGWHELIRRGMLEDHSWHASASLYQKLYTQLTCPTAAGPH